MGCTEASFLMGPRRNPRGLVFAFNLLGLLWFSSWVSLILQFKLMLSIRDGIKHGSRELLGDGGESRLQASSIFLCSSLTSFLPSLLFKTLAPFCQECYIEFVEIFKNHSVFNHGPGTLLHG